MTIYSIPESNFIYFFDQLFVSVLLLISMRFPFRIKRLQNGMPFLYKEHYIVPGMILSFLILFLSVILNNCTQNKVYGLILLCLILASVFIFYYWRRMLTKSYIDTLNQNTIQELNEELKKQQLHNKQLEEDNEMLAKIIHRDNKLIPALEHAVEDYLHSDEPLNQQREQLLSDIQSLAAGRKGMLDYQTKRCNTLPLTDISVVDHLLQYMQVRANENNIDLQLVLDCNVKDIIDTIISADDLRIILADLIENAIIATKHNSGNSILINLTKVEHSFSIHISDCGIPFTKEILFALGKEQKTTHKEDGGSGIGLIDLWNILEKTQASLLIDEYETGLYSKKVAIIFNNKQQYTLQTYRDYEDLCYLRQRSDLIIIQK